MAKKYTDSPHAIGLEVYGEKSRLKADLAKTKPTRGEARVIQAARGRLRWDIDPAN